MPGLRNRHQRQIAFQPIPGVVERAGQQCPIVKAVNHQHRHFDFDDRRFVFRVRLARVVAFVVIEHRFHVRTLESFDVLLLRFGVFHPVGYLLDGDFRVSVGLLEVARVLAVLLLLRIVGQFARKAAQMRQIENDQFLDVLRLISRQRPRYGAAPIVPDDDRFLAAQMLDHGDHVAHQQSHVVILDALRLVGEVVAALVNRHDVIIGRQRLHLVAPRIPEIGEAVDHHDQWVFLVAERGVMNLHSAGVGVAVFDALLDVIVGGERGRE
ncbi:MAG: hypothetical protein JMDDDDMK_05297 [Acidobacteria bacterium]|nr:hypothetical protein [Acidobacteriota bacterium]